MDVIVERKCTARFRDGSTAVVHLRIGRPCLYSHGDWACPVQADGLESWRGPSDIIGVDAWQAMMLGIAFLRANLAREQDRGTRFFWYDDDSTDDTASDDLDLLFPQILGR